ncbi:gluconokinase [Xaviernesmea rhizosphaerae]|nr:gluconokinase [Xaviernesmea rhizosphaerae]
MRISGLVVMGVSGCGKSSVAAAVAQQIGGRLIEGDAFHPEANLRKMTLGQPLTDDDRAGWLDRLSGLMTAEIGQGGLPVLACSALKARYRTVLRRAGPGIGFLFLDLDRDAAAMRVATRPDHFMPASLIDSQFAALERPSDEPAVLTVDATAPIDAIVRHTENWLQALAETPQEGAEAMSAARALV